MDAGRFETLLDRFQNGEASHDEMAELESLLRADGSKRRRLVERFFLESLLYKLHARTEAGPNLLTSGRPRWFQRIGIGAWVGAAAVLVAVGVGLFFLGGRDGTPLANIESGQIRLEGAAVTQIPEGKVFDITGAQPAVIRLADGSRAEFAPFSRAALRGRVAEFRQVVDLAQGGGKFTVDKGAGQFRVETPVGNVTVLGTEFTVKLPAAKKMEVVVSAGKVKVQIGADEHVMAAGDSRVFDKEADNRIAVKDGSRPSEPKEKVEQEPILPDDPKKKPDEPVSPSKEPKKTRGENVLPGKDLDKNGNKKESDKDEIVVKNGIVKSVHAGKKVLTLTQNPKGKGKGLEQSFDVANDVRIFLRGQEKRLSDVKTGMYVELTLGKDRKSIIKIDAR